MLTKSFSALLSVILILILSGCALAPLSNSFTARSLKRGRVGLDGGCVIADSEVIPSLKFAYGISSRFDLGLQYDSYTIGPFGKYSIINELIQSK